VKLLRKLSTGALGAVLGVTSVIVIPLATASPAAAGDDPAGVACTAEVGYVGCLRFSMNGADQTFTVPAGVTQLRVKVWGAGGGGSFGGFPGNSGGGGGAGGFSTGSVTVAPDDRLTLSVGGGGSMNGGSGGYGNGGAGGTSTNSGGTLGASGGGASGIWSDALHTIPLLVAGGGGGSGASSFNGFPGSGGSLGGGGGGGLTGGDNGLPTYAGSGGTQLAGGSGASSTGCGTAAPAGTSYQGGAGGSYNGANTPGSYEVPGGGGGGGWFGGGGGSCQVNQNNLPGINTSGGPGGGGSGYITTDATEAASTAGANGSYGFPPALPGGSGDPLYGAGTGTGGYFGTAGSGQIVLEWTGPPTPTDVTTTGIGTALQSPEISVPTGGTLMLLDANSQPVNTLTTTGQGEYDVNAISNVMTFTPVLPYVGTATPVKFRVTDSTARTGDAAYTPTVTAPAAPTPPALDTSGTATAVQTAHATVPSGGSITLLTGGLPTNTITSSGEGVYTLAPSTGVISFAPQLGFSGDAAGVAYQVTNAYNSHGSNTYVPTVEKPEPPTVPNDPQSRVAFNQTDSLTLTLPAGGHAELPNPNGVGRSPSVPGTWTLDTDVITFTPTPGFVGDAGTLSYTIFDAYDQSTEGSYTVTMLPPAGPAPQTLTSVGDPDVTQTVQPVIPADGSANFTSQPTAFSVQGVSLQQTVEAGVYVMDSTSFAITFTPNTGFNGDPTAATFAVTDSYHQRAASTYQPHVVASPVAVPMTSSGNSGAGQQTSVTVPGGGSAWLVASGVTVASRTVAGQGTYVINPGTGLITFTPVAGFSGTSVVTFRLIDSYERHADATYTVTVKAVGVASATGLEMVILATSGTAVPVTCKVSAGKIGRCDVTLSWRYNGKDSVVGSGSTAIGGAGADGQVVVRVQLNPVGHYLAGGLGGVPVTAALKLWQVGNSKVMSTSTTTRFVNNSVVANPVYFGNGSSALDRAATGYLNTLRGKFAGIRRITCAGDTELTSNWLWDWALATGRANNVCSYLTRGTAVGRSTSVHSERSPAGTDGQPVRRTDIRLYY
jgi:CshA-type fibril repeat protein